MKKLLLALLLGAGGCGSLKEPPPSLHVEVPSPVVQDWRFHEHRLLSPILKEKLRIWETCSQTFPPRSPQTLYLCVWVLKPTP